MTTTNENATSTKVKATHSGTCQVCGAHQKLPRGLLSKHGYNVQWGFFSGVCNGTAYLPFEQSCDRVELAIRAADAQIVAIRERIEVLRSATGNKAWVNYYGKDATGYKSGYRWEECEIVERHIVLTTGYEYDKIVYVGPDGKDHETGHYQEDRSVAGTVAHLNGVYIEQVLQKRIAKLKQYVAWQQERVANWKPGELTPVEQGK